MRAISLKQVLPHKCVPVFQVLSWYHLVGGLVCSWTPVVCVWRRSLSSCCVCVCVCVCACMRVCVCVALLGVLMVVCYGCDVCVDVLGASYVQ